MISNDNLKQYLTVKQAAKETGLSESIINRFCEEGWIECQVCPNSGVGRPGFHNVISRDEANKLKVMKNSIERKVIKEMESKENGFEEVVEEQHDISKDLNTETLQKVWMDGFKAGRGDVLDNYAENDKRAAEMFDKGFRAGYTAAINFKKDMSNESKAKKMAESRKAYNERRYGSNYE